MPKFSATNSEIPKPNFSGRPMKGTVITLTPEQTELLKRAGFNHTISFIVGSPISSPVKEYPRQETPHMLAKQAKQVPRSGGGRQAARGGGGRQAGTLKPKRLFQD
jgi:hypothetical protein